MCHVSWSSIGQCSPYVRDNDSCLLNGHMSSHMQITSFFYIDRLCAANARVRRCCSITTWLSLTGCATNATPSSPSRGTSSRRRTSQLRRTPLLPLRRPSAPSSAHPSAEGFSRYGNGLWSSSERHPIMSLFFVFQVKSTDPCVISGYLLLKTRGKSWMKRWFSLHTDFVLYSFKTHEVCFVSTFHSLMLSSVLARAFKPVFQLQ